MPITPKALEKAWKAIHAKTGQASGSHVLEQALIHGEVGLSAVIRVKDGMQGILIRVPMRWKCLGWQVHRFAGVHFEPPLQDNNDRLLAVMLADTDAEGIFANFAADLATAISSPCPLEEKMIGLMDRIGLWRRFFQNHNQGLSEEEVRGLIGELEILGRLLLLHGADLAMDSWRGPQGELHDFHLPDFRVEVKSWINESLPRIFISNPSQIVIDGTWPIWVAAVQLSKDHALGSNLPDRVKALADNMNSSQRVVFDAHLSDAGYLSCLSEMYTHRYSVRETVFYLIEEGFPFIDPTKVPSGITCLKYALELGALAPFLAPSPIKK